MNLDTWKTRVAQTMQKLSYWLQQQQANTPYLVYGTLTGLTLWPLVEQAAQTGQLAPAIGGLYSVAAGVGANLVANQVEAWKNRADKPTEAEVMAWTQQQAQNPDTRDYMDEMIAQLDTLKAARLTPEWHTQLLAELQKLGNLPRFEATLNAPGFIIQGQNKIRDIHYTHVEKQEIHSAPPVPDLAMLARNRYLRKLINECNALPLAAMDSEDSKENPEEVGLEQVYIDLNTTTRVPIKGGEKAEARGLPGQEKDRPLSVLAAAAQQKRLVLLGDPGSGKSSFVRHLAAWLASACLGEREPPPGWPRLLPILTTLRQLAPRLRDLELTRDLGQDEVLRRLRGAVWAKWQADLHDCRADQYADALEDDLLAGRVILILDGLDEVAEDLRPRVRAAVTAILQAYPQLPRILITCRIRSWHEKLLPGFAVHTLAPLEPQQIKQFVSRWYGAQTELGRLTVPEAQERITDLQTVATGPDLRQLAENPMLLTTMALIHQQKIGLPKQRVKLYSQAVQVLTGNWQKRKGLTVSPALAAWLDDKHKLRPALNRLGYEAHRRQATIQKPGFSEKPGFSAPSDQPADLTRGDILALLEMPEYLQDAGLAAEFLDYVDQRAGLLVGRGNEGDGKPSIYTFPHRTFQEYLAGCYLVTGRPEAVTRTIYPLAEANDYWTVAVQLGAEEVLYQKEESKKFLDLAYGLCPGGTEPDTVADWRRLLWSGTLAGLVDRVVIEEDWDAPDGGARYLQRLTPRLVWTMSRSPLPPLERAEAARALAALGEPNRPHVRDVDAMHLCLIPAGPFWMGSDNDEDDEKPLHQNEMLTQPYWLGRFPVTNAQFEQFVADGGYQTARYWPEAQKANRWRDDGWVQGYFVTPDGNVDRQWREGRPYDYGSPFNLSNHPVVGVMWYEALAFCRWLTERWQAQGWLPPGYTVQLPSEAEWEKGARGGLVLPEKAVIQAIREIGGTLGTLGTLGNLKLETQNSELTPRRFPWGDGPFDAEHLNGEVTKLGGTSGVGCFLLGQSVYGCEEVVGNVWEWTRSLWGFGYPYTLEGDRGREDLTAGERTGQVIRGGSYLRNETETRCAFRYWYYPRGRRDYFGFRVVLSPSRVSGSLASGDSGL